MPFNPINLIDAQFQFSSLFNHLPVFDEIYYEGQAQEKVQRYRAVREGQDAILLAVTIIRKDEDFLWDSAEDLLKRAVTQASAKARGVYNFDLLAFDLHKETRVFDHNELAHIIFNHSLKLRPGEQRLIKYCSCYGLLQKLGDESWGKVIFKSAVEVFDDKPTFLFSLVKRLLKDAEFSNNPVIALVNDLSTFPLYNPKDENQQGFLAELVAAQAQSSIEFPPEVYVQDKNGVRELLSGTEIKSGQ